MEYKKDTIINLVTEAYKNYGSYVNLNRFIPNSLDGLKPSYRKAIYATMKVAKDGLSGVDSVLGYAYNFYNHGPQYLVPVICKLAKYGIFKDDGANGSYFIYGDNVGHAASRYLETGVEPFWYKLFGKLIDYVPYVISDKGHKEPEYIPTPIPLGLTFGYNAISCGSNTEIPPMTPRSLIKAMTNNDPEELKLSFGLELIKEQSNLQGIWTKGSGKLTFRYPHSKFTWNNSEGILISGNPVYFSPNWKLERQGFEFTLDKLIERNQVEVLELPRAGNIKNTFIKIKPNCDYSIDEIESYVDIVVTSFKLIKLSSYVTYDNGRRFVTRLSLRSWLALCYGNYINLLKQYKQTNIERLIKNRTVLEWLPKVADILIEAHKKDKDISNEEIANELKIEPWIVSKIVEKPISALRRKDTSSQIDSINKQIEEFTEFDEVQFTNNVILSIPE